MLDNETLLEIVRLKEVLSEQQDASDSDGEYGFDVRTNRGNKLKRGARTVACTVLNPPGDPIGVRVVDYNGDKRALIYKRRRPVYSEDLPQEGDEDGSDVDLDEPELLDDVHLGALLQPITSPADLPHHPAISRTYTSGILAHMARESLDMIVEQKHRAAKLANLLSAFLGDDPTILKVRSLNIPQFTTVDDVFVKTDVKEELPGNMVGITSDISSSGPASSEANGSSRRLTRSQTNPDVDPFFAAPEIHTDRDFGVKPELAEQARQLLQVAHQRIDEYVRCMTEIRMGLTQADRRRRQVLNWCREMNGEDYVEEDIGPDLHHTWVSNRNQVDPQASATGMSATERSE